eukprot:SAG31_NODE_603_length_13622_cov_19.019953_16_plen_131_part_00
MLLNWAGDPCVQIWGGPEHHFVGNECVVGHGLGDGCMPGCGGEPLPDPVGLDSGSTGGCKVDWNNLTLASQIGHISGNTYWTQVRVVQRFFAHAIAVASLGHVFRMASGASDVATRRPAIIASRCQSSKR